MMRSLFSAISGLRNHQTFMDVVGNNISNVNTTAFKASRVTFQDIMSQTLSGASAPTETRGGTNPVQVGLGSTLASIDTIHTQGSLQSTGRLTDLAIQGDGYFVLSNGLGGQVYTRDGSFSIAVDGSLVNANGLRVLGWMADPTTGAIDTTQPLQPIVLPRDGDLIGMASTTSTFYGNLDQRLDATDPNPANKSVTTSITVYDSLGQSHQITVTFTKTDNATNQWSWTASTSEPGVTVTGNGTLQFDSTTGLYNDANGAAADGTIQVTLTNGAANLNLDVHFSSLTQLASSSDVQARTDGAGPGSLSTVSIGVDGQITGIYTSGARRVLGQIATATFANPAGLVKIGNNLYEVSPNAGDPDIGAPTTGSRGEVRSGFLEMSNVDLAQEFTNMILAERGFQANSRIITATDEMLQDLVNIRR
ncbi:MAG TPA: flagellar hook protein FlgE [Chloroflexota bacterium]